MIIEILRDEDNEMVSISVDGKPHTEGNFWDIDLDTWIGILEKIGVTVIEEDYTYVD